MKKRILSIALVAVMIVAMIPAMLIPTAAIGYYDGYDGAIVAEDAITVDGSATPDAAYLAGEKIINRLNYNSEAGQSSAFEGYIAADDNGFYFWISVVDESLDKGDYTTEITDEETGDTTTIPKCNAAGGDRVELYIRSAGNNADARSSGHIGFDYLGQITKNARYGAHDVSLVDYATTETETGWVGELYVPWEALATGFADFTTDDIASFSIGIQCNNMKNDGSSAHRAYCYDSKKGGSYYRGMFGNHEFASGDNNSGYQGSHLVPVNFVGFKTPVVANALTVDGVKDAAYEKSEAIVPYVTKDGLNYTAYAAATLEGLYIFADIKDATLDKPAATTVDQGDKFQAYFQMGDHFSNANWAYIEMDYTTDADTVNYRYVDKGSAWYGPAPTGIEHAYTTNDEGWTAEIFVPWSGEIALNGLSEFSSQAVSIALQANDSTTGAIAYSDRWAERAWYANNGGSGSVSGNFWFAPLTFVFDEEVTPVVGNRWAKYVDAITLDGVKDDKYDALAGEKVNHVYVQDATAMGATGGWHRNDIVLANVYYAFTDTDMYVFVEVFDNTVPQKPDESTAADLTYEYVTIYHSTDDYSGKFNLKADGTQGNAGNYEGSKSYVLYDGTNAATANLGLTYVGTKEAYTGYNVEFKIPLAAADKAAIAAGEPINVKVGVEVNNAKADGKRIAYGYSESNGGAWWVGDPGRGYMTMPDVLLDKDFVADNEVKITGANVALDGSINVNYYADIPFNVFGNVKMEFEQNGKKFYADPVTTSKPTEYKFTFTGIAPQCIGDNIKATLLIDGEKAAEIPTYSVLTNLNNVKNDANKALVEALLHYGAAAQKYNNYKLDALVNDGLTFTAPTFPEAATVKAPSAPDAAARICAAGVYHANTNKIYVKVEIADATGVKELKINGTKAEFELDGNIAIAYTGAIKATDFDNEYSIELVYVDADETDDVPAPASQTLTYSVNDYAFAMKDGANANADLALALYAYGVAAEAYLN